MATANGVPNVPVVCIMISVLDQHNCIVRFKVRKDKPLRRLMTTYCATRSLEWGVVRFRFDGKVVNEWDTPADLEMEDGDIIEIYKRRTGGAR